MIKNPNVEKILVGMRELLAEANRWAQGTFSKNKHGQMCLSINEDATCWCLSGALTKVVYDGNFSFNDKEDVRRLFRGELDQAITSWNDNRNRKHVEIIQFLDKMIRKER